MGIYPILLAIVHTRNVARKLTTPLIPSANKDDAFPNLPHGSYGGGVGGSLAQISAAQHMLAQSSPCTSHTRSTHPRALKIAGA